MTNKLAVINTAQLVTLANATPGPRTGAAMSEIGLITNGAMLVENGRVAQTGPQSAIEPLIDSETEVVDAGGRVVLPGFVDAHAHPVFAGVRADEYELRAKGATYQEIAQKGGGIRATVRKTREATEDELVEAGKRYANWFLRGGTTTLEAKSGYGLTVDDELKMLRAIRRLGQETPLRYVPTFLGAHEIPDEYRTNPRSYVKLVIEEMLPRVVEEGLAEFCDAYCEEKVFTLHDTRLIMQAAKKAGLKLRLHADQLTNNGGAVLAAELKAVTADHLEHTDITSISVLKRANVQPVLLPASVYALGLTRYPQARAMINAGLAVVLATDFNPGSSPTPAMPMILSLACTHLKMTPAEAITAATINAAHSLGRGDSIGSLEPGKRADFVIHDCADYREIAYFFGVGHAYSVYLDGKMLWQRNY